MDWLGWEQDVLAAGGWPVTAANVRFLSEWHPYEESACKNNPLNTKEPWPGASNCLANGVKAYATTAAGAGATAATIKDGFYPNLGPALATGDPYSWPSSQGLAQDITTWGTPSYAAHFLTSAGGGTSGATTGPAFTPNPQGPASSTVQVTRAWTHLMRTLALTVPDHLDKVAAARSRIRASVR